MTQGHLVLWAAQMRVSAWVYWQALEQSSDNMWGFIKAPFSYEAPEPLAFTLQKQYHMMMHFTRCAECPPLFNSLYSGLVCEPPLLQVTCNLAHSSCVLANPRRNMDHLLMVYLAPRP